jgi:drug/metabolite transporter (DMT)-like permease
MSRHTRLKGFLAAGLVILCWSGFNIVSRLGGRSALTPFDLTAFRFAVAGIILTPIWWRWGRGTLSFSQQILLTLLGSVGYASMAYLGFSKAPAVHAAILINGGIPLMTALLTALWLKTLPNSYLGLGLLLTALGLLLLGWNDLRMTHQDNQTLLGDLFFLIATTCWATYGLLLKRWMIPPIVAVSTLAVFSALIYWPIYYTILPKGIHAASWNLIILECLYQGIVAAIIATFCYAYAIQALGTAIASLTLAVVPVLTAILGVIWLNESLSGFVITGVVLVTLGATVGALMSPQHTRPDTSAQHKRQ